MNVFGLQSMVLLAKPGVTPDLSLQRRVTTTSVPTSNTKIAPPAIGVTAPSPGTDLRRRSVGIPPAAQTPMLRDPSIYGTPAGQTNGQGFMQREYHNFNCLL